MYRRVVVVEPPPPQVYVTPPSAAPYPSPTPTTSNRPRAQDLVLLGVVPIIVLGALADAAFKVLINLASVTRPPQSARA